MKIITITKNNLLAYSHRTQYKVPVIAVLVPKLFENLSIKIINNLTGNVDTFKYHIQRADSEEIYYINKSQILVSFQPHPILWENCEWRWVNKNLVI